MNRKQIPIEDHRVMGSAFRVAHALLLRLMIDIQTKGGVSKNVKCHNALHTAHMLTLDARNILENALLEPFSREEANEKRLMHCYGGPMTEADVQVAVSRYLRVAPTTGNRPPGKK